MGGNGGKWGLCLCLCLCLAICRRRWKWGEMGRNGVMWEIGKRAFWEMYNNVG